LGGMGGKKVEEELYCKKMIELIKFINQYYSHN